MAPSGGTGMLPYLLLQGSALPEWMARSDGELLAEYVQHGSELAFATLVRRHGPMVWNVCYRLLRHYHDAEDAFQATFLVLARRAAEVQPPEMLANWLYGVARHTAHKARHMAAKRKAQESAQPSVSGAGRSPETTDDLVDALYEELAHLPSKFRTVVVLCDLEGQTRKEAARQLRVPEGTVAGWLARARKMLSRRLAKRGLVLSGASVAALLGQSATAAPYPTMFHTVRAAAQLQAGQALAETVSAKVAVLVNAVLRSLAGGPLGVLLGASTGIVATVLAWSVASAWLGEDKSQLARHEANPAPSLACQPQAPDNGFAQRELPPHAAASTMAQPDESWQPPASPEPLPVMPSEKPPSVKKARPESPIAKKPNGPKSKDRPREKPEEEDEDDTHKVEGVVSDVDWQQGTLTIQRLQQRHPQTQTYRFGQWARVWHKGKPADMTVLTRGAWVELELSPKDQQILLVKLKPPPKNPDQKKT
ncbi:ECF RNA polymerase sigma factor SigW [bacterium HR36]|nr:ECF RNA polymerase sigma factor SigW [bacterium HR36]